MRPVFDTNVYIDYAAYLGAVDFARTAFSSVLLYELTATTSDNSSLQKYQALLHNYQRVGRVLTPAAEDWWECAKVVRRLRYGQRSFAHGPTPRLQHAQQLQNDALIARTAYLNDCVAVTVDIGDYQQLSRFMKVNAVSARDYFGF